MNVTASFSYDANGNRTQINYGIGYTASYAYDQLNRLTDVYEGAGTGGLRLGHYTYDALGRRSGASVGGSSPVAGTSLTYTSASQIQQIAHTFNGSAVTFSYSYNSDHQLSGLTATDSAYLPQAFGTANTSYTSNNLNQYTNAGTGYTYTSDGSLQWDGLWFFNYDSENHLAYASGVGPPTYHYYDFRGRRHGKSANSVNTHYLSAGDQELAEFDTNGNLLRLYVYGPGLDEPLATVDGSSTHLYYFADAQGSTVAMTYATGIVEEEHAYSGYGTATNTTGTLYQYRGRRLDAESGLYYYRARHYSPKLGRFLQPDPIGTKGGINLYAYVLNDPLNLADSMGTEYNGSSDDDFTDNVYNAFVNAGPELGPILRPPGVEDEGTVFGRGPREVPPEPFQPPANRPDIAPVPIALTTGEGQTPAQSSHPGQNGQAPGGPAKSGPPPRTCSVSVAIAAGGATMAHYEGVSAALGLSSGSWTVAGAGLEAIGPVGWVITGLGLAVTGIVYTATCHSGQ